MKQNDQLREAKSSLYDSEFRAIDIKREMNDQTGKIKSAINKVRGIYGDLTTSNQLISEMHKRILKNRIVYYLVILLVLTMFTAIIY